LGRFKKEKSRDDFNTNKGVNNIPCGDEERGILGKRIMKIGIRIKKKTDHPKTKHVRNKGL